MLGWLVAGSMALADTARRVDATDVGRIVARQSAPVTLVHVWGSWCGACKSQFEALDQVTDELGSRGLAVVAVAAEMRSGGSSGYLRDKSTTWTNLEVAYADAADLQAELGEMGARWSGAVPFQVLVDADGNVVDQWVGARSRSDLERRLSAALPAGTHTPRSAEVAAVEQGIVRLVLTGRDGDSVYVDGWNAGVLPLETELVGGLHMFRVEGTEGRVEVERNVDFSGGAPTIDLGS